MMDFKSLMLNLSKFNSRRENRQKIRRLLLEQLSNRRLLANDLGAAPQVSNSMFEMPALEQQSKTSEQVTQFADQLKFELQEATKVSLTYRESLQEPEDYLYQYT
jgi:hypothetical protein